jgi:hypothetical protein
VGAHPRERVRTLVVNTPASTAEASPQSTTWELGQGYVARVDVVIPSGHVGLTGVRLLWGGRVVMPYEEGEWLTGNDDEVTVALELYTGLGRLVVETYNLDEAFTHSHHLRGYITSIEEEPLAPLFPGILEPGDDGLDLGELPDLDEGLTPEEWSIVSTALDSFIIDLQNILGSFLSDLSAMLGVAPPNGEPAPEEGEGILPPPEVEVPGRIAVPNVVGKSRENAREVLRTAGFGVDVRTKREQGREVVIEQQPEAGKMRDAGFVVTITVRQKPK